MPRISVIIPCYNTENYLSQCIESVISQDFHDWEMIIIDDGSTDKSAVIAAQYASKDNRIKVNSFEKNGPSYARNKGLEFAKSELLTFVDADDMLLPGALHILEKVLIDNEADIVEGRFLRGKEYHELNFSSFSISTYTGIEALEKILFQKQLLPSVSGKLYKRSLFDGVNFTEGILYEDLCIMPSILVKCKKLVFIDRPVYFYRDTPGSIINSWSLKRLDILKVTEGIENNLKAVCPALLPAARDRRLSANFNMFALGSLNNDQSSVEECWEIVKKYRKKSLLNSKVRLKNKIGIIASYFGKSFFLFLSRFVYK